ncbi:MAG: hypothetical protein GY757_60175 [bacterium]|nr:hypothetical protein [bacterium]
MNGLKLLYRVFFFPQALRASCGNSWDAIRGPALQAVFILLFAVPAAAFTLSAAGLPATVFAAVVGTAVGFLPGIVVGKAYGPLLGTSFGLTFASVGGIFFSVVMETAGLPETDALLGSLVGAAPGAAAGMALASASSIESGVDYDIAGPAAGGLAFATVGGITAVVVSLLTHSITGPFSAILVSKLKIAAYFSLGLGIFFFAGFSRLPDYLFWTVFAALPRFRPAGESAESEAPAGPGIPGESVKSWACFPGKICHVTFLPLPRIGNLLEELLKSDWEAGLYHANRIPAYTMQFIPVIKAISRVLESSPHDVLLARVSAFVESSFDWNMIRFCSEDLHSRLRKHAFDGFFFFIPAGRKRKEARLLPALRTGLPAHAACAGFYRWHLQEPVQATAAFKRVKALPHGAELYKMALAIERGLHIDSIITR